MATGTASVTAFDLRSSAANSRQQAGFNRGRSGTCRCRGSLPPSEAAIYRLMSVVALSRGAAAIAATEQISRRRGRLVVTFDDPIARQSPILTFVLIVKTIYSSSRLVERQRAFERSVTFVTSVDCSISAISLICDASPSSNVIDTASSTASYYFFFDVDTAATKRSPRQHRVSSAHSQADIATAFRVYWYYRHHQKVSLTSLEINLVALGLCVTFECTIGYSPSTLLRNKQVTTAVSNY